MAILIPSPAVTFKWSVCQVITIFLYENHLTIAFNYKKRTHTVTLAELQESGFGSDLEMTDAPSISSERI